VCLFPKEKMSTRRFAGSKKTTTNCIAISNFLWFRGNIKGTSLHRKKKGKGEKHPNFQKRNWRPYVKTKSPRMGTTAGKSGPVTVE